MKNGTKKRFRGSLAGYKRSDVTGYILELAKKYSESEEDLKERIKELEKEAEDLRRAAEEAEERASAAEKRAEEAESSARESRDGADRAAEEIEELKVHLRKRVREIEEKYGTVKRQPEKRKDLSLKTVKPRKERESVRIAEKADKPVYSAEFDEYMNNFRSATSALFEEFDRKYGTDVSGSDKR